MTLDFTIHRFCSLLLFLCLSASNQGQVSLNFEENYSLTYDEAIQAYIDLDQEYPEAKLLSYGSTDIGKPLNLFVISSNESFEPHILREQGKRIILILNGIHPGESCGIDASVLFARDILERNKDLYKYLDNTVVCIVPVYNIGGALNRSSYHRTTMDPPVEAGFRGNAQNLDLNRDFIKLDSRNAMVFTEIFRLWDPDVFLDNHVTNGSDHQYTITLINSVIQRIDPGIGNFLEGVMLPELYSTMKDSPYEMIPYVHFLQRSPDKGIIQLTNPPRFSLGYTCLYNSISFLNETHVYKPFPDQVKATYHFMRALLESTNKNAQQIGSLRKEAKIATALSREYVLDWELDSSKVDKLYFKGYAYKSRVSQLTGLSLPYYDHNEPWEREIPYYKTFKPGLTVNVPDFFIIPQVWTEVISRLELNRIEMNRFTHDTIMKVEVYFIDDLDYGTSPYNGHFIHSNIKIRQEYQEIQFYKGDVIIPLHQEGLPYLMETLDPRGQDSFMVWNFFDPILDRREYIDPAIFEQTAIEILKNDAGLRSRFEKRKVEDPGFAQSGRAQLYFIYTNSEWAEKSYRRYPVYRMSSVE
jgi:hypothetical protein